MAITAHPSPGQRTSTAVRSASGTLPDAVATEVARWNRSRRVAIHTIAIGPEPPLLRQLAMQSGGIYLQRKGR